MEEKKKNSFVSGIKEAFRKFMVALKRKPQMIALAVLVVAFLEYSLNLSVISDTTAKIQGSGMGLCGFCTMLFSMLAMVCFSNAFPHRKPVNKPMLILMFVMIAIIITADIVYIKAIYQAVYRENNPIAVTAATIYIAYADQYLRMHIIIMAVAVVAIVLLPVYSKLIRKVDTSVTVEGNADMGAIDISSDD